MNKGREIPKNIECLKHNVMRTDVVDLYTTGVNHSPSRAE